MSDTFCCIYICTSLRCFYCVQFFTAHCMLARYIIYATATSILSVVCELCQNGRWLANRGDYFFRMALPAVTATLCSNGTPVPPKIFPNSVLCRFFSFFLHPVQPSQLSLDVATCNSPASSFHQSPSAYRPRTVTQIDSQ